MRKEGEEWEVKVEEEEKEGKVEEEEKDKCVICRCHQYVICKLRKCKKPEVEPSERIKPSLKY